MTEPLKEKQDGSLMSKLLALEAQGKREIDDNKVLIEVGQQGLDSLRVQHPKWDDYSSKKKVGIAKYSDPIILAMSKDMKTLDYDAYEKKWNPAINKFTEHQALKQMEFSGKIYNRESSELSAQIKNQKNLDAKAKAEVESNSELGSAIIEANPLTNTLFRFSTTSHDSSRANVIDEKIDKFIYEPLDITTIAGVKNFDAIDMDIQNEISEYVNNLNVEEIQKIRKTLTYVDKDGETQTWNTKGKSEIEVRNKIESILQNRYKKISQRKLNSEEKKKVKVVDPLGLGID